MADPQAPRSSPLRTLLAYTAMLVGAGLLYWLLRGYGLSLQPPLPGIRQALFGSGQKAAGSDALMHVLLALVTVIVVARGVGSLFAYFAQPPVVGEILAGILLGPSLLGRFAPTVQHYILPPDVAPFLGVLSNVGVILYMFLVGVELDPSLLRKRGHATLAISHASIEIGRASCRERV